MKNVFNFRNTFLLLLVLCAASTRLMPHPYNFTAMTAIALFAGAKFANRWIAFLVPVSAMLLTDSIIGFDTRSMYAVYGSFLLIVVLGMFFRNKTNALNVIASSLVSSVLFYLITNFAVWPGNLMYTQDLSGLMHSYIAGIPFFRNQVVGDLFYSGVLFTGFALAEKHILALSKSNLNA